MKQRENISARNLRLRSSAQQTGSVSAFLSS
jgi:hypothetical protein